MSNYLDRLNEFVRVYNDTKTYSTAGDVACALSISAKRVQNKAGEIRNLIRQGVEGIDVIITRTGDANNAAPSTGTVDLLPGQRLDRKTGRAVPLSEDERKFRDEWGPGECIEHLRAIATQTRENGAHTHITRNAFRNHSDISDATWSRYFGTFNEFRRQADLELSRHAHRIERSIAKHASVDLMEKVTEIKRGYEGKYERDHGGRFRTILVGTDFHGLHCDPFVRRLFIEANRRIQPDVVCLNGDFFDLAEFSNFSKDPREFDVIGEIEYNHELFGQLREDNPDAQMDFIEGNHEFRLLRHMSESTPALKVILDKLHGLDVPKLLGLDRFEMNYTGRASLKAWRETDIKRELARNFKVYYDCVLACHYPERRKLRMPGWGGHHHKHEVWPFYNPAYGACEFHQMGGGHVRAADYCDGEAWQNGFLVAHVDTERKSTAFEYVQVQDFAVMGGVFYRREDSEIIIRD